MSLILPQLASSLGPDTSGLCMRFGLHSGPVTAGVLRGEKGRFQLFGDTVNTASRMESTGQKNRIQVSQATADLLTAAGKNQWIQPRESLVAAKGKGEMQTYWVQFGSGSTITSQKTEENTLADKLLSESDSSDVTEPLSKTENSPISNESGNGNQKNKLMIEWNTNVLRQLIKKIVASRGDKGENRIDLDTARHSISNRNGMTVLDEAKEAITLPVSPANQQRDPESVQLSVNVDDQLLDFVTSVESLYPDGNAFHSFEHASHVTMAALKLASRISFEPEFAKGPSTQFAIAFAALVHDIDHAGIPNSRLIVENPDLAALYENKSVAEQRSVDVAWELLMQSKYKDLRECIFLNQEELDQFRQIVVNAVMSTDIADKELGASRKARWERAFPPVGTNSEALTSDELNLKAAAIIEHLMQAADVSHTMQHWNSYTRWNERLFREMHQAYKGGRSDEDPSIEWYAGELAFFDRCVIPLANGMAECGVFGGAGEECSAYARANRAEWESKGQEVIAGYLTNMKE